MTEASTLSTQAILSSEPTSVPTTEVTEISTPAPEATQVRTTATETVLHQ